MFYVYIIKSRQGKLYVGCTQDLFPRLEYHAKGKGALALRGQSVLRILYHEKYLTLKEARRRERQLGLEPREERGPHSKRLSGAEGAVPSEHREALRDGRFIGSTIGALTRGREQGVGSPRSTSPAVICYRLSVIAFHWPGWKTMIDMTRPRITPVLPMSKAIPCGS